MSLAGAFGGHSVVVQADPSSAPTSSGAGTCRGWPPARSGRRWRSPSPAAAPTCRRSHRAPAATATLRGQRLEDLDHQRPPLRADRAALQDRPDGRAARTRDQHPARRARAGLRSRADLPKLGYKGVEACELVFDDCRGARRRAARRRVEGQGFAQMMAGLESRPDPGCRPGARRRAGRVRRRARVRPGAGDVRQADLAAPVGGQLPRRHGHQGHGGPAADLYAAERLDAGRRADMEAGMAKLFASEVGDGGRARRDPRSTAATGTPPSSTSSATSATPR